MSILEKYIPFVKEQISVHDKLITKFASNGRFPNEYRYSLHQSTRARFQSLLEDIESADNLLKNASDSKKEIGKKQIQLQIFPSDLEGLPQDLLDELSVQPGDSLELTILKILEDHGGIASLDQLLIGIYRATEEVHKRSNFTAKLYRMIQKGMIFSVPGKKGVYSLKQFSSEEEVTSLLMGEDTSSAYNNEADDISDLL